jgi:hypothetical protein
MGVKGLLIVIVLTDGGWAGAKGKKNGNWPGF